MYFNISNAQYHIIHIIYVFAFIIMRLGKPVKVIVGNHKLEIK